MVLLVVDDDAALLRALERMFRRTGWSVLTADSARAALARLESSPVDVVISDHGMPEITGVELLECVRTRWPGTARILMSGDPTAQVLQDAINRAEVFRFFSKPLHEAEVQAAARQGFEAARAARTAASGSSAHSARSPTQDNLVWNERANLHAGVSRLAAGVAHEINNPLAGILAFAQILRKKPCAPEDEEPLQLIEDSALRCKRIVDSLMRLAGDTGLARVRVLDLHRMAQDAVTLFSAQMKSRPNSKLELRGAPAGPIEATGDGQALGQVLMDLLFHRLHALPQQGGTLALEAGKDDASVFWRLTDTAPLLDEAARQRLLQPGHPESLALLARVLSENRGRLDIAQSALQHNEFVLRLNRTGAP